MRRIEKAGQGRFLELEQHIVRLHLGALAVQGFHLERSGVVGEDGADFEAAILFKKNVHGRNRGKGGASLPEGAGRGKRGVIVKRC